MLKKTLLLASLLVPAALTTQVFADELQNNEPVVNEQIQKININSATVDEIAAALRGVGKARAEAIVKLREERGRFTDIDELLEIRGLGIRTLNENRERIVL